MRVPAAALALSLSACALPQVPVGEASKANEQTATNSASTRGQVLVGGTDPGPERDGGMGEGSPAAMAYVDAVLADLRKRGVSDVAAAAVAEAGRFTVKFFQPPPRLADAPPAGAADEPILHALRAMVAAAASSPELVSAVAGAALAAALEPAAAVPADDALDASFRAVHFQGKPAAFEDAAVASLARAYSEFAARPDFALDLLVAAQHQLWLAARAGGSSSAVLAVMKSAPAVVGDHLADAAAKAAFVDAAAADAAGFLGHADDVKFAAAFLAAAAALDPTAAARAQETLAAALSADKLMQLQDLLDAAPPEAGTTAPTPPPAGESAHAGAVLLGFNGNGTCPDFNPDLAQATRLTRFIGMGLYKEITVDAALKHADYWLVSCYSIAGKGYYVSSLAPNLVKAGRPVDGAAALLAAVAADKNLLPDVSVYLYGYSYGGADALATAKNLGAIAPAAKVAGLMTVDPIGHDCRLATLASAACRQFPAAYKDAAFLAAIDQRVNLWQDRAQYLHSGASTTDGAKDERVADAELPAGFFEAHVALQDQSDFFARFRAMFSL